MLILFGYRRWHARPKSKLLLLLFRNMDHKTEETTGPKYAISEMGLAFGSIFTQIGNGHLEKKIFEMNNCKTQARKTQIY